MSQGHASLRKAGVARLSTNSEGEVLGCIVIILWGPWPSALLICIWLGAVSIGMLGPARPDVAQGCFPKIHGLTVPWGDGDILNKVMCCRDNP